jgi:hypothetical protein
VANLTITNNDLGSVILQNAAFRDELLTFGGAGTVLEGTILARKRVNDAVTVTPDVGNTGDGTVTLATVAPGALIPEVGAYNLEVTTAVANGGVLKLENPDGAIVATELTMTVGAGAATVFEVAGLQFTVTDGATDFVVGDKFALTVVANNKMVVFDKAGAGGAQLPVQILTYEVTAAGAGDEPIRSGVAGQYRKDRLVIDADGDASNVDATVIDQLRDYGLVPIDVQELNILDNQ